MFEHLDVFPVEQLKYIEIFEWPESLPGPGASTPAPLGPARCIRCPERPSAQWAAFPPGAMGRDRSHGGLSSGGQVAAEPWRCLCPRHLQQVDDRRTGTGVKGLGMVWNQIRFLLYLSITMVNIIEHPKNPKNNPGT